MQVSIEKFGLGNQGGRSGDWTPIRVRLKDGASKPRDVIVRVQTVDVDGDMPQMQRVVSTSPGTDQGVWMYTRLPFEDFSRRTVVVTVHEAREGDVEGPTELRHVAGRLLGRAQITPGEVGAARPRPPTTSMIGVIGARALGLGEYGSDVGTGVTRRGQELTEIITGLSPEDLPDRWMGLASLEALVWGAGDVSTLRQDRARAVTSWVQRGGHLIIVLPPVGQNWTTPVSNPLYELMPAVVIERREDVDLLPFRPLLYAGVDDPLFPQRGVIHTFRIAPDAGADEAIPILRGPDGTCVVARRLVGAGMVTLIGFDLNQTALSQGGKIDADIFWHRVLGRRGNLTQPSRSSQLVSFASSFRTWTLDRDIMREIAVSGQAAVGALLGFVLFGAYWLAVGPPAFFVLKKWGLHKHSWTAFVGGSAVFTVLAWGGATLMRPMKTQVKHLTILDHVYGQPLQRARMWASVLVPKYGTARISVGDASGEGEQSLHALSAWEGTDDDSTSDSRFTDTRGYPIDTHTPDAMNIPVRSTVKTIQADWCGAPTWSMPHPVEADGRGVGTIRITPGWTISSAQAFITGTLVHELPGDLEDVRVIVVQEQTTVSGTPTDALLVSAFIYPRARWAPGEPMDLEALRLTQSQGSSSLTGYLNGLAPSPTIGAFGVAEMADTRPLRERLIAASLIHQLPPPPEIDANSVTMGVAVQRRATQTLELARWFTQPCVIVIGFVKSEGQAGQSPVPLFVDGKQPPSTGLTMVRWVYPLPASTPRVEDYTKQVGRRRARRDGQVEGGASEDGGQ